MNVHIYCFDKGLFINKKFVKKLKNELKNEFGELEKDEYVHLNMLLCKVDKDYNSYFNVYEQSCDLDRLINALTKVSNAYELNLSCELNQENERDILNYIREQVKNKNITVSASMIV